VILYADVMTDSIKKFLAVTEYRRQRQIEYNQEHNITPRSVSRAVEESLATYESNRNEANAVLRDAKLDVDLTETIGELETEMLTAAEELQFEKAACSATKSRNSSTSLTAATGKETKPVSYRKQATGTRKEGARIRRVLDRHKQRERLQ